jgi:uncharacterized protein (TIGR02145 family)
VFTDIRDCFAGPYSKCEGGGLLSNSCPYAGVSSSGGVSISSSYGFAYCVYEDIGRCARGPFVNASQCVFEDGSLSGYLSNACPFVSSSSAAASQVYSFCVYPAKSLCASGSITVGNCVGGLTLNTCPANFTRVSANQFCVYPSHSFCLLGPHTKCDGGGLLSYECPNFDSPIVSSSSVETFASCVIKGENGSCNSGSFTEESCGGEATNVACSTFSHYCVDNTLFSCIKGIFTECDGDLETSNDCPDFSGRTCDYSYNKYETFRTRDYYCSETTLKKYDSIPYEGQTYKTVVIGSQTWMAENLNYLVTENIMDDGTIVGTKVTQGNRCLNSPNNDAGYRITDSDDCKKNGRVYSWTTAMKLAESCNTTSCGNTVTLPHRGICPEGWHIPSLTEFKTLVITIGGDNNAQKLKTISSDWDPIGTDMYGFSLLPGLISNNVVSTSQSNPLLSSTEFAYDKARNSDLMEIMNKNIYGMSPEEINWEGQMKSNLSSLRCIKN